MMSDSQFFHLENPDHVGSPGLLVDRDRVEQNIGLLMETVGGTDSVARLRPHVKTHKMPELVRLQQQAGIHKFKTATIAEARMVAETGGADVLLAYQPVGPNVQRLAELVRAFPQTTFSALVDNVEALPPILSVLGSQAVPFRLYIDVDCGMHRTGVELGVELDLLRDRLESDDRVSFAGLHVYDGHLHNPDVAVRRAACEAIIDRVRDYQERRPAERIIGGGSPTFAIWAEQTPWECSPGTPLLWDYGYASAHPDLDFRIAAALITRVISKPGTNRICLDLGHKSVAAENPLAERVFFPAIRDAKFVSQSEEHLVIETEIADTLQLGEVLFGFPKHICPTVALHAFATVVSEARTTGEEWRVTARDR